MKKYAFALLLSLIVLGGCASNQSSDASSPAVIKQENPNIMIDDSINIWLDIENITSLIRMDNMMEVEIVGRNIGSIPRTLAYRVDWYDQNGFVIKSILTKWKVASVEEGRNIVIRSVRPSVDATNYKVRITMPTETDVKRYKNLNKKEYKGE
ncbi:MAG: DUF1425 domain-containing protein [Campylobacteraceae bacterium]